jgi:hypothetical protein
MILPSPPPDFQPSEPNKLQQPNPPAHHEGWMDGWMDGGWVGGQEKHFFIGFKFPS